MLSHVFATLYRQGNMAMKGFTVSPSIFKERCNVGQFRAPQNVFFCQLLDYKMVDHRDHILKWSEHLDLECITKSQEYFIQFKKNTMDHGGLPIHVLYGQSSENP